MPRSPLVLALTLASCSMGPPLADDEIEAHDWPGVAHAKAGMSIAWRCQRGDGDPVTEETKACVAAGPDGVVVEEREAGPAGTTVTAYRYAADGALLAAWRGPAGGAGVRLRLVPPVDPHAEARSAAAVHGVSVDDAAARAVQSDAEETVDTPAGRFACRVRRNETSALFLTGYVTSWYATEPLPLSQLVRFEMGDSWSGSYRRQMLSRYAWTGAVPTLAQPSAK